MHADADDRQWRREGECNRCGECCRSGDPFAPRVPKSARQRPCSYYRERDGVGECVARAMTDPPGRVQRYLEIACYPWPSAPSCLVGYDRCGFSFEVTDGG